MQDWGKIVMLLGAILLIYGIFLWRGINPLYWVGNLPGDIHFKSGNTTIYVPIVTMLLFSILFTVLMYLFRK